MSNCGEHHLLSLLKDAFSTNESLWKNALLDSSSNESNDCGTENTSNGNNSFAALYPTVGDHSDPYSIDHGLDFYAYFTPIIIIVGLFGNSISLCIFQRKALKKLSASVYLSAICVSDTCVLLIYVLLDWLNKGLPRWPGGARVSSINHHGFCQAFLFFSYTFRIISVWLIIVFTFERYIAICWPFHRRLICTKSFSFKLIGCVSLMASFLCLYKPIISGVSESGSGFICARSPNYEELNFILDSIYGVLITALPFIIITLLNILILKRLVCSNNDQKELKIVSTKESKMRLEFTFILLSISTCFIGLNLPYFIVWCQRFSTQNEPSYQNGESTIEEMLLHAQRKSPPRNELFITRTIFYINYSINFFLYCLTGKQYRKYMIQLLCCKQDDKFDRYGSSCRSGYTSHSFVFNNSQKSNGSQMSTASLKSSSSMGRLSSRASSSKMIYSPSGSSIGASRHSFTSKV